MLYAKRPVFYYLNRQHGGLMRTVDDGLLRSVLTWRAAWPQVWGVTAFGRGPLQPRLRLDAVQRIVDDGAMDSAAGASQSRD